MLYLGIDVAMLALFGLAAVMASILMALAFPLDEERASDVITAVAITSVCYVIFYCVMVRMFGM